MSEEEDEQSFRLSGLTKGRRCLKRSSAADVMKEATLVLAPVNCLGNACREASPAAPRVRQTLSNVRK